MSNQGFGAGPVRPGHELDWPALAEYRRRHLGVDGRMVVAEFQRGSSNLNYLVGFGDTWMVVRRPPFGYVPDAFNDMSREHEILSKLWREYPRAPRSELLCADESVIGSQFVVHDLREGEVIWDELPGSFEPHSDAGRRLGFAVIDALADLHQIDPDACGLGDIDTVEGFVRRQIDDWRHRWSDVADPDFDPLMRDLASRLAATSPIAARRSIVHLDFKLNNCQFASGDPDRVTTVFDWDMATLGDPLMGLGILLNHWPDPADTVHDHAIVPTPQREIGMPTRAEAVDWYCARTGADASQVTWYEAFGAWRTAIVRQIDHWRYFGGRSDDPIGPQSIDVPMLIGRARRLLAEALA